jgi:SAM-dependent methyltransferase
MNKIEMFYNEFGKKLLTDFAYGNPRIISAIEFTLKNISIEHKSILDIGCGIGWTSYEIAKNFPDIKIDAIDLSANSIEIANRLFNLPNLKYQHIDVTSDQFSKLNNTYDLIILIDVLEHIAPNEKSKFIKKLSQILNENGMIILTYPSPEHQMWLKDNSPAKLQPIDETISLINLLDISNELSAKIMSFQYKNIWHSNDYNYAILKRRLDFSNKNIEKKNAKILTYKERKKLLLLSGVYHIIDWKIVQNLILIDYPKFNLCKKIKIKLKKKYEDCHHFTK